MKAVTEPGHLRAQTMDSAQQEIWGGKMSFQSVTDYPSLFSKTEGTRPLFYKEGTRAST